VISTYQFTTLEAKGILVATINSTTPFLDQGELSWMALTMGSGAVQRNKQRALEANLATVLVNN
jgi:hypothetical protein